MTPHLRPCRGMFAREAHGDGSASSLRFPSHAMKNVTVRARFDDRESMESAVHALLDEGFRKRSIRITRTTGSGHRVREGSSAMRFGGIVGGLLGAVAVIFAIATLPTVASSWAIAFRLLGAVAGGALTGALAALILSSIRDRRSVDEAGPLDWLVRVRTDPDRAPEARDILDGYRGHTFA